MAGAPGDRADLRVVGVAGATLRNPKQSPSRVYRQRPSMLAPSMDPVDALIAALPLARKVELLSGRDNWSLHPAPQLGLDAIFMADGPNGVRFGSPFDERHPTPVVPSA